MLETRKRNNGKPKPAPVVLCNLVRERGVLVLWTGCTARLTEGIFSGAILLLAKESIHSALMGCGAPPMVAGFLAGAGGGASQALVMGPCALLVTTALASRSSVLVAARTVWQSHGLRGLYTGSGAVAVRQASNWASRQGFTDLVRPRFAPGASGEFLASCVGGMISCWNTPFEVARIESQMATLGDSQTRSQSGSKSGSSRSSNALLPTLVSIYRSRGLGGLYAGLLPRMFQACFQTTFMVCIPKLLL